MVEEVVPVPVRVIGVGGALLVASLDQALRQGRRVIHDESHVVHPGMDVGPVRPPLRGAPVLDAQVGFLGPHVDPALGLLAPSLPSHGELGHGRHQEAYGLVDVCRGDVQVLQKGLHTSGWGRVPIILPSVHWIYYRDLTGEGHAQSRGQRPLIPVHGGGRE